MADEHAPDRIATIAAFVTSPALPCRCRESETNYSRVSTTASLEAFAPEDAQVAGVSDLGLVGAWVLAEALQASA